MHCKSMLMTLQVKPTNIPHAYFMIQSPEICSPWLNGVNWNSSSELFLKHRKSFFKTTDKPTVTHLIRPRYQVLLLDFHLLGSLFISFRVMFLLIQKILYSIWYYITQTRTRKTANNNLYVIFLL